MHLGSTSIIWICTFFAIFHAVWAEKYRLCIVDGKGKFKKSQNYCSRLDKEDSKVECVVAVDRLDCLRRISKGTVDFSVFTAEDLVTSENAGVEILLTNELRFTKNPYEYQIVAVVDNRSGIKSRHDLKEKRYCHPGYGYESDWSTVLSNFFEATVATTSCDEKLTLTENRIKATADFFGSACKAGPWVHNPKLDLQLKKKYPNLCERCSNPATCSQHDEYWGRRGSLLCLTSGSGDVSWARLDDVQQHFGLTPGGNETTPDNYSLLCPDDTVIPLNTTRPCIWADKPWPVVGSRRVLAQDIQELVSSLKHENASSWRFNLRYLLDSAYADFIKIDPVEPIQTYLDKAVGFLSANSFSGCHPPRIIKICTTSIKETAKCQWLRESSTVYGIEPSLDCIKADNTTHCMKAVEVGVADLTMVPSDLVHVGMKKYALKTLFYETVTESDKYLTVAVTRRNVKINSWEEMRGKKTCFPVYDGVAWNTVKYHLSNQSLIRRCPLDKEMSNFFGSSCTPKMPTSLPSHMAENCQGDNFEGDFGALHCLTSGVGDVAFVSKNALTKFLSNKMLGAQLSMDNFDILCLTHDAKNCHLSWTTVGRAMVRKNSTDLWTNDTLDVFMFLNDLFGKNFKTPTTPLTLFGKYDGTSDLLFHDVTVRLRNVPTVKDTDTMPYSYDAYLQADSNCILTSSSSVLSCHIFFTLLGFFFVLIK